MSEAVKSVAGGIVGAALGIVDAAIGLVTAITGEIIGALGPQIPDLGNENKGAQALKVSSNPKSLMVVGTAVISGDIMKYEPGVENGTDYHYFFLKLATHRCTSVKLYQLDGKTNSNLSGTGYYFEPRLGDQTGPPARALSKMNTVDASFIGTNVTDVYCEVSRDPKDFPHGLQDMKFEVDGAQFYDPRKDSTVGGIGNHRLDDPLTWEWTENPVLIAFWWEYLGGPIALPLEMFTLFNIAQAANICDELVDYIDSDDVVRQQKRYTCNGFFDLSSGHEQVRDKLLTSCGGAWVESGAKLLIRVAAYYGPATITITEKDLVGTPSDRPHTPLSDKCNRVTAEFISKDAFYQSVDSTPVESEFLKSGRDKGVTYEHKLEHKFTNDDAMSQRLGVIHMLQNAAGKVVTLQAHNISLRCVAGTVVQLDLPKFLLEGEFEVINAKYNADFKRHTLELKETGPGIFNSGQTPALGDVTPNVTIDNTNVDPVTDIAYTPKPYDSDRQGVLTWSHPKPSSVQQYIVLLVKNPDDGNFYKTFSPVSPVQDIANLAAGAHTAIISAKNVFGKSSVGVPINFSVGLPNTPVGDVTINILPGRLYFRPPAPPNPQAEYEFRHSFVDDFDSTELVGPSLSITIGSTPHGGTAYVWYRLIDGDLKDTSWLKVIVPNLIGIAADAVNPDFILGIEIPGLPGNIADTFTWLSRALNDQQYYGEELAEGQAGLLEDIVAVAERTSNVETAITTVSTQSEQAYSSAQSALAAIASESQARALLEEQVNAAFGAFDGTYLRQVDLFTSAGAASAAEVETLRVQLGDGDVDDQISAQINSFSNAQIGYDDNGTWIEGALFAQAFNEVRIEREGSQLSVFQYFEALEDELGNITGQIQFAIDINGKLTGIFIEGSETASDIVFVSNTTQFVDTSGNLIFGLNSVTNEFEFNGSGTFSGTLKSPQFELVGATFMKVELADGFGPDNLWYWYGPRILNAQGEPDLTAVTKANAVEWKDTVGNAYFGGALSAGVLRASARNSSKTPMPSIEIGPFSTNGNAKQVVVSLSNYASYQQSGLCDGTYNDPTATVSIERKIGSGAWESLVIINLTGTTTAFYDNELDTCFTEEYISGGQTYTDNSASTADFSYRAVVTAQQRHHQTQFFDYQFLSISSTES